MNISLTFLDLAVGARLTEWLTPIENRSVLFTPNEKLTVFGISLVRSVASSRMSGLLMVGWLFDRTVLVRLAKRLPVVDANNLLDASLLDRSVLLNLNEELAVNLGILGRATSFRMNDSG
jgi:hypothetical protein